MAVSKLDVLLVDILHEVGQGDIPDLVRIVNRQQRSLARKYPWRFYQDKERITVLAAYTTGEVSLTEGSGVVTGDGTTFTSAMVGRKFQSGTANGFFTITAYSSATSITIDPVWPYDSASEQTFVIYQDEYALPTDAQSVTNILDAVTQMQLRPVNKLSADARWSGFVYTDLDILQRSVEWPWEYCLWGLDTGVPKIRLNGIGEDARYLDVYYYRTPAEVTSINSTPDIAEYMEEALHQMVFAAYCARSPAPTSEIEYYSRRDKYARATAAADMAIREAKIADTRLITQIGRNARVLL